MSKSTYSEKLKDPRWQKKRLAILERDGWHCLLCGDGESTLHVHHMLYLPNIEPWEYPDWLLRTICDECHREQTANSKRTEALALVLLYGYGGFWPGDVVAIAKAITCRSKEFEYGAEVFVSILEWALQDPIMARQINEGYWASLKKKEQKEPIQKTAAEVEGEEVQTRSRQQKAKKDAH